MLHVQLDVNWVDNEKVMDAGWEGAGVHAGIMCLAKRLNTDGWVPLKLTRRYLMPEHVIDALVALELLERDDEGRVRVHDWHERNPTKAAIAAKTAAKVRAGKAGNHQRHGHFGDLDKCRICYPETEQKPSVVAPAIAEARSDLANASHPSSPIYIDRDTDATAGSLPHEETAGVFAELRAQHGFLRSEASA